MEAIVAFLVLLAISWGFGAVVRTMRAAGRAALGKGSLSDNLEVAFKGMSGIQVRLIDSRLGSEPDAPQVKEIQVKGLFPIHARRRLGFVTSVFDNTSGELEPITSMLEMFQERHTRAYQQSTEVGYMDPGVGFVSWVKVGAVLPQVLQAPFGGKRKLSAVLRLIDLDRPPDITGGFHAPNAPGLVWQHFLDFEYAIEGKGYRELELLRGEARTLCVKIALCIAMWNGALGDREGEVIKSWIQKVLTGYSGGEREKHRAMLNEALKEGYEAAKKGKLSLTELTYRLKEIDDNSSKYEVIELCYDVLTARAVPESDAARIIDLTARFLELDLSELEKIRDVRVVGLKTGISSAIEVEDLLGVDPAWDVNHKKRHLRSEFQKWNNRLSGLSEGPERDNAQRMLDAISEARRQYG